MVAPSSPNIFAILLKLAKTAKIVKGFGEHRVMP
jgi:hypothetical protein